mmetsp:Transcript_39571/g.48014  ORF Transcript_39571/g.48014 Transcript_39571/m.48014 type:complete len:312 (+) Transcript_39571:188-1123(+)|eukprot:CAMPEP_0197844452 /NCGR_PEP_ID=MMETSP1438-20131217/1433_1 /TAXON_ID=1461541 /ORGANISM="Pterosperma sp., Strain CCMP1384" /LENGTH=311 /DNA_ID=CAMNT_0043455233 /DNA_START=188 /DNA_END=1123 /DNA_ORIENTATION=+
MGEEETSTSENTPVDVNHEMHDWMNGILTNVFKGKLLVKNDRVRVEVNDFDINCYGDVTPKSISLDGSETAVQFKIRIILGWAGFYHVGDSCLGEYRGKLHLNDLTNEHMTNDAMPLEYKQSDGKSPIDEELKEYMCEAELAIYEDVVANEHVFKGMVREFMRRLNGEDEKEVQDAAILAPQAKDGYAELPKDLRRQACPEKLKQFLETKGTGSDETELHLSFCSILDDDLDEVLQVMENWKKLTYLDFSYNSLGDAGVQKIVAALCSQAIAPDLKTLKLGNNQFGIAGENVLKGLSFLRKTLKVETGSLH